MDEESTDHVNLESQIRDLLAEFGVQPRHLEALPEEAARAELDLARILSDNSHPEPAARGRRAQPWRRAVLLVAAAAVALGLVVVHPWTGESPAAAVTPAVLQLENAGGLLSGGSAGPASQEFEKLATMAENQPMRGEGPVQRIVLSSWVLSTEEETGKAPPKSGLYPVASDRYFLADGKFRTIEHRGPPLDDDGRVPGPSEPAGSNASDTDETFDGPTEGPGFAETLPIDPARLKHKLIPQPAECAGAMASCLASRVTFLYYNYVLSPSIASALWRLLADEPGFTYAGQTRDRLNRRAVAFTSDASDRDKKLILLADPQTGALMGSEEVLVQNSAELGLKAPAVIEFTALVDGKRISSSEVPDPSLTTTY